METVAPVSDRGFPMKMSLTGAKKGDRRRQSAASSDAQSYDQGRPIQVTASESSASARGGIMPQKGPPKKSVVTINAAITPGEKAEKKPIGKKGPKSAASSTAPKISMAMIIKIKMRVREIRMRLRARRRERQQQDQEEDSGLTRRIENTYRLEPKDSEKFMISQVEPFVQTILRFWLDNSHYTPRLAARYSGLISEDIIRKVKQHFGIVRYKLVAYTVIGSKAPFQPQVAGPLSSRPSTARDSHPPSASSAGRPKMSTAVSPQELAYMNAVKDTGGMQSNITFASRVLGSEHDTHITTTYSTNDLFCVATIFAFYAE